MKKNILNYEGLYQIDDSGVVYSTPTDGKPNRELKQEIVKHKHTSYRRVSLSKNGEVTRFSVHRLVAKAFIQEVAGKTHVNHIDNNGENNNVSNLEWCTHSENMKHASNQGRLNTLQIGIKGGETRKQQSKERYANMEGKIYGRRQFIRLSTPGKHPKAIFKCLDCLTDFEATIGNVLSGVKEGKYLACRSCSMKYSNSMKI